MSKVLLEDNRRVSRRTLLKGMGLAAGTLALSGSFAFRGFAQPPVVKVGTLLDYTGALAEFGPAIRNGCELAAAHINEAATEVLGGPIIQLIHEDSGTTASIGIDRANKLVNVDGVVAIVGSLASGVTVPVAESVTIPAQVVQISPASTSPLLTVLPADRGKDFLFRTTASDELQGAVAAQLAAGQIVPGWSFNTASLLYVNNPYGQGFSEVFTREFQKLGGTVLAQVSHPEEPQATYVAQLQQALNGNPGVLVLPTYPGHATVFLRESISNFNYTSWQFTDGTRSVDIINTLGAQVVEGKLGTNAAADPTRAGNQAFLAAYNATYGAPPPLPYIDTGYDAVAAIGLAIAKAIVDGIAAITGHAVRDILRLVANQPGEVVIPDVASLKAALSNLKDGISIDYSGAGGEVEFDDNGDVVTPIEIFKYSGGTIVTETFIK